MDQAMTYKVVWADRALCDLERIITYLKRRNPAAAAKMGGSILRKTDLLARHPELGRVSEDDAECRVIAQRPYKIYYRVLLEDRIVEVLHLRHGSQDSPDRDDLGI